MDFEKEWRDEVEFDVLESETESGKRRETCTCFILEVGFVLSMEDVGRCFEILLLQL